MPERHGPWDRVYDLFRRWQRDGTWARIFTQLQAEADAKGLITWEANVDSTVCRAHQHAAGAAKSPITANAARIKAEGHRPVGGTPETTMPEGLARDDDASNDLDTRVWVRGCAAIALGYEGAALPIADVFADQATAISERPSLGLLNAVFGKAHTAALRGDHTIGRQLLAQGRRIFARAGSHEQTSATPSPGGGSTSSPPCSPPGSATRPRP
ncbi:hypothetical protein [Streptomyces virginiae]|uniref:hypothetical protein n=1 Tax=Streptomyces virginiae TaxID=1961 RepID=UPI0036FA116D